MRRQDTIHRQFNSSISGYMCGLQSRSERGEMKMHGRYQTPWKHVVRHQTASTSTITNSSLLTHHLKPNTSRLRDAVGGYLDDRRGCMGGIKLHGNALFAIQSASTSTIICPSLITLHRMPLDSWTPQEATWTILEDAWAVSNSKERRLRQSDKYYFDQHLLVAVISHQTPLAL